MIFLNTKFRFVQNTWNQWFQQNCTKNVKLTQNPRTIVRVSEITLEPSEGCNSTVSLVDYNHRTVLNYSTVVIFSITHAFGKRNQIYIEIYVYLLCDSYKCVCDLIVLPCKYIEFKLLMQSIELKKGWIRSFYFTTK